MPGFIGGRRSGEDELGDLRDRHRDKTGGSVRRRGCGPGWLMAARGWRCRKPSEMTHFPESVGPPLYKTRTRDVRDMYETCTSRALARDKIPPASARRAFGRSEGD